MSETYCGKSCAECAKKETLNCPGCKAGPGRPFGGDCKLAHCARDKGHETCITCALKGGCVNFKRRDEMQDFRIRRNKEEEKNKTDLARKAPFLGKWLWIIFWLIIPSAIGSIMTHESMAELLPGLAVPGQIIKAVCTLIYGAILLKVSTEEYRYQTAGICALIAGAFGAVSVVAPSWTGIFTLPADVVAVVGEYQEYMAHSAVLTGVDYELSLKWETLWKWYIGLYLGMFGCVLVILFTPVLGALALIGCAIGTLVVSILKLIYLYRTAVIFRAYPVGV